MTLMWLRAESKMITSVRQSMAVAVGRQRRAAPTGRLMALGDVGPAGAVP